MTADVLLKLIAFLKDRGVLDFVNSLTTVVIGVFAGVQWFQVRSQRRTEIKSAHSALWVEYWRIWTISANWQNGDIEHLTEIGLFNPSELLPSDWGSMLPLLGLVGPQAARLGGTSYSTAKNAAARGEYVKKLIERRSVMLEQVTPAARADIHRQFEESIKKGVEDTRALATEAAQQFEDALQIGSAMWLQRENVNFSKAKSDFGKRLGSEFQSRPKRNWLAGRVRVWTEIVSRRLLHWAERDKLEQSQLPPP